MRRALLLGGLSLAACQTESTPAADRPVLFEFEGIASPSAGTLQIVKTVDHSRRALFQQVPVQQNGVPNNGSGDVVELVTLSVGECDGPGTFGGPVQINSFFGSPITDIVAQITSLTPVISVQPNNTESFPPLDNTNGLWVHGAPGTTKTWCFDVLGGADFRFRGRVFADVPTVVPQATCAELVTSVQPWGAPSLGVDLRARTNSELHWIGCPTDGCTPAQFFCDDGAGHLHFGATGSVLRAMVDPGNALGDGFQGFNTGCSSLASPNGISNAPDVTALPSGINPVAAICAALGFPQSSFLAGAGGNSCPDANALAADGSSWNIGNDPISEDGGFAVGYCCHTGGGCPPL